MGTLLRGISERFNPQIHTEEKSLTVNMRKHMEIKNKTFELFAEKSKFTSWLRLTNRVNVGVLANKVQKASSTESIYDNAYRIAYKGSLFIPAYCFGKCKMGAYYTTNTNMNTLVDTNAGITYAGGIVAATVAHGVVGTIAVKHDPANNIFGDKYNQGDAIGLGNFQGPELIVQGTPVKASSGDHYLVNFMVNGTAGLFSETMIQANELLPESGNRFGEGSTKGAMRERRYKWRINYSFISRSTLTVTGSALKQRIAWVYNSDAPGTKLWELEAVMDLREAHAINVEMGLRHSRMSMDPSSHAWFENYGTNLLNLSGFTADYGIVAPVIGDGWISQLEDSLTISYDPNNDLDLELVEMFMTVLAQRSPKGSSGNTFVIIGDKLAHIKIDKALKAIIGWSSGATVNTTNTNVVIDVKTGAEKKIGFTLDQYDYLNNSFVFIEDELSNHPAFAPQNGGIIGTGTMYVLNASMIDGVPNVDLLERADRGLVSKYVDGLHSLDPSRDNSSSAFSGFDGGRFDILSETLPIIYSTESCGIIKASAKFTGGALSGQPVATQKATVWHY